ncbi:MAG: acyloxyacyl hydrolase [Rhodobacteraceae bacterium]|nr:acyloxyacyl hydrolase [Paracoccaceae bacterium]
MKGEFAVLFALMSLFGEGIEGEGWNVQRADVSGQLTTSAGLVVTSRRFTGRELRMTYLLEKWKRYNTLVDFSLTEKGGAWLGYGLYQQFDFELAGVPVFAGFSFTPGIYVRGGDIDLGFPLEFRSGVELGLRFGDDWRVSISYDHRSNGDIARVNPGMETLQLRVSKSFN